jgi:DedD protein
LFDFDENRMPDMPALAMPDTAALIEEAREKRASDPIERADINKSDSSEETGDLASSSSISRETTRATEEQARKESLESIKVASVLDTPATDLTPITEEQPKLDDRGIPLAYVIQLGTFTRWENANKLRDKLNDAGYSAYIRPETSVQPGPYRVQVGPFMLFSKAKETDQLLRDQYQLSDSFIRRFATRS